MTLYRNILHTKNIEIARFVLRIGRLFFVKSNERLVGTVKGNNSIFFNLLRYDKKKISKWLLHDRVQII